MRLTLRTLLAYLDDVLEPADAKEIGKKIQESPLALGLVSRIREVMRRRRLGAPDLMGPGVGIDPNLVAQYLDNTLPPEQVADIERICLESDQQLAEVAACHQILSIALGEPVEITPSQRERMYVLGPVDAGERLQAGGERPSRGNGAAALKTPVTVKTVPGSAGPSFEETLPEYLKPKPISSRILPAAAVLLLVAIWLGIYFSDPNLSKLLMGLREGPQPTPAEVVEEAAAADEAAGQEEPQPAEPAEVAQTQPSEVATAPENAGVPAAIPGASLPAAPMPDAPLADAPVPEAPVPGAPVPGERPADAGEGTVVPPAEKPVPDGPKALPPVSVQYVSQEGIFLQQHPDDLGWYVVSREADLKPGSLLACPEPFEGVLEFDQGGLRATILGDSILELLPSDETHPAGIRLVRGRIILQTNRRESKLWPLKLAIGPRSGTLQFGDVENLCGIEFLPVEPSGFEQPVDPLSRPDGLFMLAGAAEWTPLGEPPRFANKGVYLKLLTDQPPASFGPLAGGTPDWLDPQRRKTGSILRRYAAKFEEEFEANQPIDSAMRALIRDPRSRISELSVRCLALCGNYAAIVQALAQSEYEDVREAATSGLKLWLGDDPEHGQLLIPALKTYYEREEHVEALYRLLWGISEKEAMTYESSMELVEWLRSDKVEIRELAIANLARLTNRKFNYHPLAAGTQREPAVRRWIDFVEREGALIVPEEPPVPGNPDGQAP